MPIPLKVGCWYWIHDPGSNLHAGYIGPAKCLSNIEEKGVTVGGPSYRFEYFDRDDAASTTGNYVEAYWGTSDIVCEYWPPDLIRQLPQVCKQLEEAEARIKKLEKQIDRLNQALDDDTLS